MANAEETNGLIDMPDLSTSEVCGSLYKSFLTNFTIAQDGRNDVSLEVRLKNAAYNLAQPIASHLGEGGGTLADYLKLDGGNMRGQLSTLFGFQSGVDGIHILETFKRSIGSELELGIKISGLLELDNESLRIGGTSPFKYGTDSDGNYNKLEFSAFEHADFKSAKITARGLEILNLANENIFKVSPTILQYNGKDVYHAGNSNKSDVNWDMLNSHIFGDLTVDKTSMFKGQLTALYGCALGAKGNIILAVHDRQIDISGDLNLQDGYSLKIGNSPVIKALAPNHVQFCSIGGDIVLGGDRTGGIRLWNSLLTENGDHELISKQGKATFMNEFRAAFQYGPTLLSTAKDCVIVHDRLKFGSLDYSPYFKGDEDGIKLHYLIRNDAGEFANVNEHTYFSLSTSLYKPLDRDSYSVFRNTSSDFFVFMKPLEATTSIGIAGSLTKLTDKSLFFTDSSYLLKVTDGIKHFGNAYFVDSLSSERFSSGFAGEGWAIRKNVRTGNVTITIDEAIVRKKARIYELEIQKDTATNGSLWVSDACSGDTVIEVI